MSTKKQLSLEVLSDLSELLPQLMRANDVEIEEVTAGTSPAFQEHSVRITMPGGVGWVTVRIVRQTKFV
jgi:hypothetical protein